MRNSNIATSFIYNHFILTNILIHSNIEIRLSFLSYKHSMYSYLFIYKLDSGILFIFRWTIIIIILLLFCYCVVFLGCPSKHHHQDVTSWCCSSPPLLFKYHIANLSISIFICYWLGLRASTTIEAKSGDIDSLLPYSNVMDPTLLFW